MCESEKSPEESLSSLLLTLRIWKPKALIETDDMNVQKDEIESGLYNTLKQTYDEKGA